MSRKGRHKVSGFRRSAKAPCKKTLFHGHIHYAQPDCLQSVLIHLFTAINELVVRQDGFTDWELSVVFRSEMLKRLPVILSVVLMIEQELILGLHFLELLQAQPIFALSLLGKLRLIDFEIGNLELESADHGPLLGVLRSRIAFNHFQGKDFTFTDTNDPQLAVAVRHSDLEIEYRHPLVIAEAQTSEYSFRIITVELPFLTKAQP